MSVITRLYRRLRGTPPRPPGLSSCLMAHGWDRYTGELVATGDPLELPDLAFPITSRRHGGIRYHPDDVYGVTMSLAATVVLLQGLVLQGHAECDPGVCPLTTPEGIAVTLHERMVVLASAADNMGELEDVDTSAMDSPHPDREW